MNGNIVRVFPIEIWESIVSFCDGKTLLVLSRVNETFNSIISSLDKRRNIWKHRCHDEIHEDNRLDICHKLYPDEFDSPSWNDVYRVWYMWENLSKHTLEAVKVPKSYLFISDIKVSNEMIIIADKTGFAILDSTSSERKRFKIGPVKHLELLIRRSSSRPEGTKFLHDVLDCSIGTFHLFFDLHKMTHLRCDKHENQVLRYCFGHKKSKFLPPVLEANVFDDLILVVSETCIRQAVEPMNVISQLDYSWTGARCWFLWHARLLFCAKGSSVYVWPTESLSHTSAKLCSKHCSGIMTNSQWQRNALCFTSNDTFDIYLDGRMKTFPFGTFPRTSAIFYFGNILFLGSIHGTLYVYRIKADDIFSFNFNECESKLDLSSTPIVGIDIVENNSVNSCIIIATDYEIYRLLPRKTTSYDGNE